MLNFQKFNPLFFNLLKILLFSSNFIDRTL